MVKSVKNKDGKKLCPVCMLHLDGKITYAQVAGELKPDWVHIKCVGGKNGKRS